MALSSLPRAALWLVTGCLALYLLCLTLIFVLWSRRIDPAGFDAFLLGHVIFTQLALLAGPIVIVGWTVVAFRVSILRGVLVGLAFIPGTLLVLALLGFRNG